MAHRGEIYIETRRIGSQMRVSAVDGATGTEVSVFGPAASQELLKKTAIRKLDYVLNRPTKQK